jgi:hypothetical protein
MRTRIAILSALAFTGCDLTATAEADQICITEPTTQTFPGVDPPAGATVSLTVPTSILLDVSAAVPDLNERGVTSELIAQSITLTTDEDVDLSGLESLGLTVTAEGRPPVAFTYEKPEGAVAPIVSIAATPGTRVNLVDYLEDTRRVRISSVSLTGRPPTAAWTPILRTCAFMKVKVDYLEAAAR